MKVYCNDCSYIWRAEYCDDQCRHPDNMVRIDEPICHYMSPYSKINELNKNNNCKLYKRSWWKFWVKQ